MRPGLSRVVRPVQQLVESSVEIASAVVPTLRNQGERGPRAGDVDVGGLAQQRPKIADVLRPGDVVSGEDFQRNQMGPAGNAQTHLWQQLDRLSISDDLELDAR